MGADEKAMRMAHAAAVPFLLCLLAGGALAAQETELAQQALGRVEKAVMQAAKAVHVNATGLPSDVIADVVQKVTQAEVEKILQSSDFYSAIAKHIVGVGSSGSSSSGSSSSDGGHLAVVGALKKDRNEYEKNLNTRIKQVKGSEQELEDKLKELQHEADLLHSMHDQLKRLTQEKSRIKDLFAHMRHRFQVHHIVGGISAPLQYVTVPAPYAPVQPMQPQGSWQWVPSAQTSIIQPIQQPIMLNSQPQQLMAQPQQLQQQTIMEPVPQTQQQLAQEQPHSPVFDNVPQSLLQNGLRLESDGDAKPAERLVDEDAEAPRSGH